MIKIGKTIEQYVVAQGSKNKFKTFVKALRDADTFLYIPSNTDAAKLLNLILTTYKWRMEIEA
jgi:hypothetical protein